MNGCGWGFGAMHMLLYWVVSVIAALV